MVYVRHTAQIQHCNDTSCEVDTVPYWENENEEVEDRFVLDTNGNGYVDEADQRFASEAELLAEVQEQAGEGAVVYGDEGNIFLPQVFNYEIPDPNAGRIPIIDDIFNSQLYEDRANRFHSVGNIYVGSPGVDGNYEGPNETYLIRMLDLPGSEVTEVNVRIVDLEFEGSGTVSVASMTLHPGESAEVFLTSGQYAIQVQTPGTTYGPISMEAVSLDGP